MTIDFYYLDVSPFVRAVMLTAKAIGLEMNMIEVNLLKGEQMKPEFLALNPQHCVPTIVDGDFVLWESPAIQAYLVSKYAKDDSLYPNNPRKRAIIDRLMHFNQGTLFPRALQKFFVPIFFRNDKPTQEVKDKIIEAFEFMEKFLGDQKYIAGDNITIADHSIIGLLSGVSEWEYFDFSKHPKLNAWMERCASEMTGYAEVNLPGAKKFGGIIKEKLQQM